MNTKNKKPNSYIERLPLESAPSSGKGWGITGFVGTALSGTTEQPVYVESFSEFAEEFGKGANSPYMANSNLAYAVFDYFKCGGSACMIVRAVSADTKKATSTVDDITVSAKDLGSWANNIKVSITANEDSADMFDIAITSGEEELETYIGLSNDATKDEYWVDAVSPSVYVEFTAENLAVAELTLAGGEDGLDTITDADYTKCLELLENEDITWVAIPGETSNAVVSAIKEFVDVTRAGKTFAVIDTPLNATVTTLKTFAQSIPTDMGACFAPWGVVTDQLTGAKRDVPPSGAVLGNFSASVSGRGIAKTPAGVGCTCDSWIGVKKIFSDKDCGILNSANVNCIVPQSGYGICIWGSRVLKENKKQNRKYISQSHIDIYMDKYLKELTLFTVFETVNTALMEKTHSVVKTFMTELFNAGCFVGENPNESFTVICDWSNNRADADTFNIQVGYAKSKPSEFTLITIKQRRASV